jgi:hypothetical protein
MAYGRDERAQELRLRHFRLSPYYRRTALDATNSENWEVI